MLGLDTMDDWGDLLHFDPDTGLFDDGDTDTDTAIDEPTCRGQIMSMARKMTAEQLTSGALRVFAALYPIVKVCAVDEDGDTLPHPRTCGSDGAGHGDKCSWASPFLRPFRKIPVITPYGPVFRSPMRYYCTTHRVSCQADADDESGPYTLSLPYYRLGDMCYHADLLPEIQTMYVDTLTVETVRRALHGRWLAQAVAELNRLKRDRFRLGITTDDLLLGSHWVRGLQDFVPSNQSLYSLLLVLYQQLVVPRMKEYDLAVAAFDGQLLRMDGTFRSSSVILCHDPSREGRSKKKRVGGCVLTCVGLEGLLLCNPRLVPSESSSSMQSVARYVLSNRRVVLGGMSGPIGFCTDSIRLHRKRLWEAAIAIYPELGMGISDAAMACEKGRMLMLQDISHREWVFTRKVAVPKLHVDHDEFVSCIKEVFSQLRVPRADVISLSLWDDAIEEWKRSAAPRLNADMLERALLRPWESTPGADAELETVLRCLGSFATVALKDYGLGYIPRRWLMRSARRLLFTDDDVEELFPDFGYENSEQFLLHLTGVNAFFKECRSGLS